MKRARILLILGIWVAVLPYLGFPYFWKNVLFSLSGLGFIFFSFMLYREYKKEHGEESVPDNFRDNIDYSEENKEM